MNYNKESDNYLGLPKAHPASPAGGGGPGAFRMPQPLGVDLEFGLRLGRRPGPIGCALSLDAVASDPRFPAAVTSIAGETRDPDIEALDLSETARKGAYGLKKKHPAVIFTSGRRNKDEQANAMASNVVQKRNWIKETYIQSAARDACQRWVDDNKDKKTKDEIGAGLKDVLNGLTDAQLALLSKHLSGDAFDVQPVDRDAAEIKKTIRSLAGLSRFLDKEGGLLRWHVQF
jgi:hypothetical protein